MFKSAETMGPSKPEFKKEELESKKEILDIISIVDIGPKHLDRVMPENIREIISKGEKILKERRAEINDFSSLSSSEVLEIMNNRSSGSHAIQCAVNGAEDFKAFQKRVEDFTKERGIAGSEKSFSYLSDFLERHTKMNELLAGLYEIDIARRFGEAKKDKRFFQQEKSNFESLGRLISDSLEDFKSTNKEAYRNSSEAQEKIKNLEKKLAVADYEGLEKDFYGFCQDYSKLIFIDYEQFNADKLRAVANSSER